MPCLDQKRLGVGDGIREEQVAEAGGKELDSTGHVRERIAS